MFQLIALAGEDMEIKLRNLELENREVKVFDGHNGPCLSVAICPHSKFLASASGDGKLRIWDIESSNLLHEIVCFPKVNSFANAKVLCKFYITFSCILIFVFKTLIKSNKIRGQMR